MYLCVLDLSLRKSLLGLGLVIRIIYQSEVFTMFCSIASQSTSLNPCSDICPVKERNFLMFSLLTSFRSGGPISPSTLTPLTCIITFSCGSASGGLSYCLLNSLRPTLARILQSMLS